MDTKNTIQLQVYITKENLNILKLIIRDNKTIDNNRIYNYQDKRYAKTMAFHILL